MGCIQCDNPIIEQKDLQLCASCNHERRKAERMSNKPKKVYQIPKTSSKMQEAISKYSPKKQKWIAGKICEVYPEQKAVQVHHRLGRVGYADQWAVDNNMPLLLDERFWMAVSQEGHDFIELNRKLSGEKGWILSRAGNIK